MKNPKAVMPGVLVSKVTQRVAVAGRIYFSMLEATTMEGKPIG
jgi:hypothetical protein